MKRRCRRIVSVALLLLLLITIIFTGCSKSNDTKDQVKESASQSDKQVTESVESKDDKKEDSKEDNKEELPEQQADISLPIVDKPITLTYWVPLSAGARAVMQNFSENIVYQELEKRTGIKMEFLHPPIGQENEQFNLMIASGDYADLIYRNWLNYPGGPDKAISDNVIIKLNDLIDKYAPNYKKFLESKPEIVKEITTDLGSHYVFASIMTESSDGKTYEPPTERKLLEEPWFGPIIRNDWLDELGLEAPTTVDEWYTVLKAFKEQKGADTPLTFQGKGNINMTKFVVGAYNTTLGFYPDNGKVRYGPIEPGYKEFLATFQKWYQEGLIDPDFPSNDQKTMDAKVTGGRAGAWLGAHGNYIGRIIFLMKEKGENIDPIPLPYPTLNKDEKPRFGQKDRAYKPHNSIAITTANKYPVESVKWLDYGYSEEGDILCNWGVEGVSHIRTGNELKFGEAITNNPEGPINQVWEKYVLKDGPFVMDFKTRKETWIAWETPKINEAYEIWGQAESSGNMPPVTLLPEESQTYASIMNEIQTYVDEMFLKFIMGEEPIENFDKYVEQIKKMGIDEAIQIQQAAYDRYLKR